MAKKKLRILSGDRFGRLVIIKEVDPKSYKNRKVRCFLCKCDCGNVKVATISHLVHGGTTSCGCYSMELSKLHGEMFRKYPKELTSSRLYTIWNGIKSRCLVKKSGSYKLYGAKGISMCNEWRSDFYSFYKWAIENGYNDGLTIDRIDGTGNYEPSNCRWATYEEQANNTKANVFLSLGEESHTYAEWGRILGVSSATLQQRKHLGWSDEKILTTPVQKKKKAMQ